LTHPDGQLVAIQMAGVRLHDQPDVASGRVAHPNVVLFEVGVGALTLLCSALPSGTLQPFLPVSRAPVSMSECQHLHARILLPVSDREGESLQNESAGIVPPAGQRLGALDSPEQWRDPLQRQILERQFTPLQVPLHGRLQLGKRGGMNLNPSTGH
jgi:hypothetical protein